MTEEWEECEKWTQPVQIAMAGKGRPQTNGPVSDRRIRMRPRGLASVFRKTFQDIVNC